MKKRKQQEGAAERRVRLRREARQKTQEQDRAVFRHLHAQLDEFEEKQRAGVEANKKA